MQAGLHKVDPSLLGKVPLSYFLGALGMPGLWARAWACSSPCLHALAALRAHAGGAPQLTCTPPTGLTAYGSIKKIAQPQPGEVAFVSAAAGAVGLVAGQLLKIAGCKVIGSAGSDDKVRRQSGCCCC